MLKKIMLKKLCTPKQRFISWQKPNLILNVDGCIAVCLVDLLRHCGSFTRFLCCRVLHFNDSFSSIAMVFICTI